MPTLAEVSTLEQRIKEQEEALTKAKKELHDYRECVKLGVLTLGTPLDDFVFVWHSDNQQYWHDFYNALANLCTEDMPIMIEYNGTTSRLVATRSSWGQGGTERTYGSSYYTTQQIGILTSTIQYDVSNGNIIFPVDFYFTNYEELFQRNQVQRKEGPLTVSTNSFKNYGKSIQYRHVEGDAGSIPHDHNIKIMFGDKEEYLKRKEEYQQSNRKVLEQETKDHAEEEGLSFLDLLHLQKRRAEERSTQQRKDETTSPNFSHLFAQQRRLTGYDPKTKLLTLDEGIPK